MELDTVQDLGFSAPPIMVVGATFLGYTLPEWAALVTIVYTLLLMIRLLFKFKEWFNNRKDDESDPS